MKRLRVLGQVAWWLLIVTVFVMPYAQLRWWPFPLSSVLLLAMFTAMWRRRAWHELGLAMSRRHVAGVFVAWAGLWAAFELLLVPHVSAEAGVVAAHHPWWVVAYFPFQALNEEMLLGALLLFPLVERWGRPLVWAVGLALVFAALHFAMYRYGVMQMTLAPTTLVALVCIGCVRHAAILLAGHIGYAWALHAAWNMVMFGSAWWLAAEGRRLREPAVFDAFLGGSTMLVLSAGAAILLLVLLARNGVPARRLRQKASS
ncbi:MAG: hypothetical protein QNJ98_07855 [Planctomycetota bacterium]|nr:hypothetical protein [Planctomycetota bacterium]